MGEATGHNHAHPPTSPNAHTDESAVGAALARYDAIRLFVERARLTRPGFALTPRNAAAVAQLCRRLDGLPLAIELAAARVRVLSVDQIAARLDERLRLLVEGSRTAPPRQQTLRAALRWSYDLLSAPERELFRRLAVFAGGFTLAAVEAICADGTDGGRRTEDEGAAAGGARPPSSVLRPADVLALLAQLVDKSLVVTQQATDGTVQFHLPAQPREAT